jgi:two-component system, sensor histidine kinase LadS
MRKTLRLTKNRLGYVDMMDRYLIPTMLFFFAAQGSAAEGRQVLIAELLRDPEGRYSIEDVTTSSLASRFESSREVHPNLGYLDGVLWVRIHLELPDDREPWLIEIGYPLLDHIQLFWQRDDGTWADVATGDRAPFASREVRHHNFLFHVPPGRLDRTAYFRIRTDGPMVLPMTLWRQGTLLNHTSDEQLLFGFYYAFLIAMAAYNLFLFALVRDRTYLFYVGYLVGFTLFQASLDGHAFMYLWPTCPAWGNIATITLLQMMLICGLLFIRRMTNMAVFAPRIHRGMILLALLCAGVVPLAGVHFTAGVRIGIGLTVLTVILLPVPVALALYHRYRPARYVALGCVSIVPGGVMLGLRMVDLLPSSFWIEHTVQFGTALEALLFSFALADRINILAREKADAQASMMAADRRALALQQAFSKKLLDVQDNERRRISQELHDGVGQNMVVIVNKLRRLAKQNPGMKESNNCLKIEEIARSTVQELREVSHTLYPHQLDRLGLEAALRQVIERTLEPKDIAYNCDLDLNMAANHLPKQAEIHIYRIVQEALSNIVRHAEANDVTVRMKQETNTLSIAIEDNGRGLTGEPGFGLASMEQRAILLGGSFRVEPRTPRGLAIHISFPIPVIP